MTQKTGGIRKWPKGSRAQRRHWLPAPALCVRHRTTRCCPKARLRAAGAGARRGSGGRLTTRIPPKACMFLIRPRMVLATTAMSCRQEESRAPVPPGPTEGAPALPTALPPARRVSSHQPAQLCKHPRATCPLPHTYTHIQTYLCTHSCIRAASHPYTVTVHAHPNTHIHPPTSRHLQPPSFSGVWAPSPCGEAPGAGQTTLPANPLRLGLAPHWSGGVQVGP